MRELVSSVPVSLDGYIAGPEGQFDAVDAEGDHMSEVLAGRLRGEIDRLVLEKDTLKERCKRLESMPTQNDAQMAAAVAQATQAAAAAAVAAAEAASRCPLRAQRSLAHSGK